MKFTRVLILLCVILSFSYCKKDPDSLSVINSNSLHQKQVELHFQVPAPALQDSILSNDDQQQQSSAMQKLDELISLKERVMESPDDKLWKDMKQQWKDFSLNYIGDSLTLRDGQHLTKRKLTNENAVKWARLNIDLLKFSGEVPFGDALEVLLYGNSGFQFPDSLLKSIIYTHVFDDIYINIIGSSSMEYQHTTGGTVKIIQDTNYPKGSEMVLKIETNDVRLLNIYIRIPTWAVNPKVSYGNVKYVAYPGQYSEVSRKWSGGDELTISLKN
ncbi:MAG: hypothetical protein ACM3O8_02185 [Methylococcaceae bacterium]|nr:hypothetical protein [Prolixibacteraceae bacterium]